MPGLRSIHWQTCLVDNLSAILRTQVVDGKNRHPQVVLCPPHMHTHSQDKNKGKGSLTSMSMASYCCVLSWERQLLEHHWKALNCSF